jgi:hypothetical protein
MSPAHAIRFVSAFSAALCSVTVAVCAEVEWQPAVVQERDGSEIHALIRTALAPSLIKADGGTQTLRWPEIASITVGDRWPIEMRQQAEKCVADLKSEDYTTRQNALQQLRALGAAAAGALRKATGSDDPEVATRSRELLTGLGIGDETPDASDDRIVLKDGNTVTGRLSPESLDLQTRWGLFTFPLSALTALRASADGALAPPAPQMRATPIQPAAVAPIGMAKVFALADLLEDPAQPPSIDALNAAGFDEVPSGQQKLKAGDSAEDVYAGRGLLLRAADSKQRVIVDDSEPLAGRSGGLAASVDAPKGMGDLDLVFIQPGSYDAQRREGRPAGVHLVGMVAGGAPDSYLGLEAYDQHGRLLMRCDSSLTPRAAAGASFLGVRATVPIVRVRVFRKTPGSEHHPLRIDDVFFDACVPASREPDQALLELRTGERLVGCPEGQIPPGSFSFRPAFLPSIAPAIVVGLQDILRYEPPLQPDDRASMPRPPGALHAVRLQNGEAFHARFVKLDAKHMALELPGGVQLILPRALVRKIDLCPQMAAAGAEPASIAAEEKPGVEFRPKRVAPGAPVPAKQEAELPRMDNAEVVSADITTGELTVDPKDGAGEWRIDLFSTRYLVFPPAAEAAGDSKEREWVLRLRQGGCFSVALTGITPDHLSAEMAGAKVTFPARTVAAVERKK